MKEKSTKRFVIGPIGNAFSIGIEEIDWIRAADNYVELHVGKRMHLFRQTLASLEQEIPPDFVRISRSLIVNSIRVKEVQPVSEDFAVVLENGQRLSATAKYRENMRRLLDRTPTT